MKTITHKQLIAAVSARAGTTFIGIDSLTDAKARKTGNPFPEKIVLKQSRFVGTIGADYGNAVNRELAKQGEAENFESNSLPWGQWEIPNKIISHKGEFYLRTQTIGKQRRNRPPVVKYRDANGLFLSRDAVAPFLPVKAESARQSDAGLEGEALQVQPRNFKLSSLLRVRIGGETFRVIAD